MKTDTSSIRPLMILGTSSGAGKSLMAAAICRLLTNQGEQCIPFKGQNMSNNAWIDINGGEMAYSQAVQAWAAKLDPICYMNPILLKPLGDCTSEVIHLGKSVGTTKAKDYYKDWFQPGWQSIKTGLNELKALYPNGRLVIEGAGSPVEINLKERDLTNLRIAQYLNAKCILVADIERGGVFAQLIGTLALLSPDERKLIKGIIINRFRGDSSLFDSGRDWIEKETSIPVLGIMPWLNEVFPPEDSLDLLERNLKKNSAEIELAIIKLPSLSNFSDLDPLEAEPTISLRWIKPGDFLGNPDAVILPGSKQTLKDLRTLHSSSLSTQIKSYAKNGGNVFGICGGLQILGKTLNDPKGKEGSSSKDFKGKLEGLNLLPIETVFLSEKSRVNREIMTCWPQPCLVSGFEIHHGISTIKAPTSDSIKPIAKDPSLGWVMNKKNLGIIGGTYLHGIFDNGNWRRHWINELRKRKGLSLLPTSKEHYKDERDKVISRLSDSFKTHIDLSLIT